MGLQHAFREIKRRVNLLDLLREVGFKPQTNGHAGHAQGLCPFHGDSASPSLHVYPDGHARCFGACGRNYDAFDVWTHVHGGTFMDAARALARDAGVDLPAPDPEDALQAEARREASRLYEDVTEKAEGWLWSDKGADALAYLHARGLYDDTIHGARLGYWPSGTARTVLVGDSKPYTLDQWRDAGLLASGKDGAREFDILHGCIVLPVIEAGRVVYLTGRGIPRDGEPNDWKPKLKGKECPAIYRGACDSPLGSDATVVVVEGQVDTLTLQQLGIPAVGLLGASSRIDDAAAALADLGAERVVLMLDADDAGLKGTKRLGAALGASAWVARPAYPDKVKDPNALLMAQGQEAAGAFLNAAVAAAQPFLQWTLSGIAALDPVRQAQAIEADLVPYLASVGDIERAAMIDVACVDRKWLPRPLLKKKVDAEVRRRAAGDEQAGADDTPRSVEGWSGTLFRKLFDGEDALYRGLFYERTGKDPCVTLYGKRRGEKVSVPLTSARHALAALAPELGDTTEWITRQLPGIDTKMAPAVLVGSLQRLASDLDARTGLKTVTEGLHFLDGTPILVDRSFTVEHRDGQWKRIEYPIINDRYFLDVHPQSERWLPGWTIDDLNRPLKYEANEVFALLIEALEIGWGFRDRCDATIHALTLMALPCADLWQRKPLVHVRGASGSGKSRLLEGFYLNRVQGMPGGFAITGEFLYNVTHAGAMGAFGGSSRALIFDEFEGSEQQKQRVVELFRTIRVSAEGGGGHFRGTQEGGSRQDSLAVPVVAGSIEMISQNEADLNRWLVTETVREGSRADPKRVLAKWRRDNNVDIDEMRRTLLLWSVARHEELVKRYDDLANDEQLSGLQDSRFLDGVRSLLTVADALGEDYMQIARQIVEAKRDDYLEARENSRGNQLLDVVMGTPIDIPPTPTARREDLIRMPLGAWIEQHPTLEVDIPAFGLKYAYHWDLKKWCLWAKWSVVLQTILKNHHRFGQESPSTLAKVAKDASGFVPIDKKKRAIRIGGVPSRASCFIVEEGDE